MANHFWVGLPKAIISSSEHHGVGQTYCRALQMKTKRYKLCRHHEVVKLGSVVISKK